MIFNVKHIASTGSTNDDVAVLARAGSAEGLVIRADVQTAGRGRQGRNWQSGSGNLYTSVLLRPDLPARHYGELAFVAALALSDTLAGLAIGHSLKWPNDVLVQGAKISGLLLESEPGWVVLGMGVNLAHAPELPDKPTTSLALQGKKLAPAEFLELFLPHLENWYDQWQGHGFSVLRQPWKDRAMGLGQPVKVKLAAGQVAEGIFTDLDKDGALLLSQTGQPPQRILAGDVFFV